MKVWALRNKETGLYIPMGEHGRNNSCMEPTSKDRPRLHTSKRAAVNTLTAWLAGKWRWTTNKDWESGIAESTLEPHKTITKRIKEDIEIVEFELVEVKKS